MKSKILVLDTLAGISPHSLQLLKVATQLSESEFELHYASCGSAAPAFCTVQESRSQAPSNNFDTQKSTCRDCKFTANLNASSLRREFGPSTVAPEFLNKLIDDELCNNEAKFLSACSRQIEMDLDLEIAGVPVVRNALYEAILKYKKKDLNFSDSEYGYYFALLRNSVRFALLGEKFFKANPNFHAVLVYAPQYAINNSFIAHAVNRGITVYFVDGNGNISERNSAVMLWDWNRYKLDRPALAKWNNRTQIQITDNDRQRIQNHRDQLADGRSFSVYSSPKSGGRDLHKFFKLNQNKKVWTLALSSLDEAFAAQTISAYPKSKYPGRVFESQYEWVSETVNWAKDKNVQIVIRMHPRDLPNKRERVKSEQAEVWEALLRQLPENVKLNHPDDNVSLHDLLEISDGFLTGWSTAALEAMDLGIPVVTYDHGMPAYPASIHMSGKNTREYFENLEKLQSSKKNSQIRDDAEEWLVYFLNRGSAQLTGRILENLRVSGPKWFPRALNALDLFFPYLWRPLEVWATVRKVKEGDKINQLIAGHKGSFFDLLD